MLTIKNANGPDPAVTDPEKYRVIFENERIRVLDYSDLPGERTNQHRHPRFVLYALGPFQRTIHLPDGRKIHREFSQGDVIWSEAQTHVGDNTGTTPTHALIVELKDDPTLS